MYVICVIWLVDICDIYVTWQEKSYVQYHIRHMYIYAIYVDICWHMAREAVHTHGNKWLACFSRCRDDPHLIHTQIKKRCTCGDSKQWCTCVSHTEFTCDSHVVLMFNKVIYMWFTCWIHMWLTCWWFNMWITRESPRITCESPRWLFQTNSEVQIARVFG